MTIKIPHSSTGPKVIFNTNACVSLVFFTRPTILFIKNEFNICRCQKPVFSWPQFSKFQLPVSDTFQPQDWMPYRFEHLANLPFSAFMDCDANEVVITLFG